MPLFWYCYALLCSALLQCCGMVYCTIMTALMLKVNNEWKNSAVRCGKRSHTWSEDYGCGSFWCIQNHQSLGIYECVFIVFYSSDAVWNDLLSQLKLVLWIDIRISGYRSFKSISGCEIGWTIIVKFSRRRPFAFRPHLRNVSSAVSLHLSLSVSLSVRLFDPCMQRRVR